MRSAREATPARSLPTPHTYTVRRSAHATNAPLALATNLHGLDVFPNFSTIFPLDKLTLYTRPPPSSRALADTYA